MVNLNRHFSEPHVTLEPPRHTPASQSKCQDCRRGIYHEHMDGAHIVPSSRFKRLGRNYTVTVDADGGYTCDCPFKEYPQTKPECSHIEYVRGELAGHPVVSEMQRLREGGVWW